MRQTARWVRCLAIAWVISLFLGSLAHAETPFYVFEVEELIGVGAGSTEAVNPLISVSALENYLPASRYPELLTTFRNELKNAFPEAYRTAAQIGTPGSKSCGAQRVYNYKLSFAVVLGITRISEYVIHQASTTVVYVPVTFNLQFVNPGTGEVIFTKSETVYSGIEIAGTQLKDDERSRLADDVITNLNKEIAVHVQECARDFQPRKVEAGLVRAVGGLLVLDKGSETGIGVGDVLFSSDGKYVLGVLSSEQGYSVGWEWRGGVPPGSSRFFKFDTKPADMAKKPRVLAVIEPGEGMEDRLSASNIFSDDIGFKAGFTMTPVGLSFSKVLNYLKAATCIGNDNVMARRAPSFFLRFVPVSTPSFGLSVANNLGPKEIHFQSAVFGQILDNGGNVLFSAYGNDSYSYESNAGKGIAENDARQVALKNAVKSLAQKFAENVKFKQYEFLVSSPAGPKGDMVPVLGAGAALRSGAEVMIYRNGGFKVGGRDVFLPISIASVEAVQGGNATLRVLGASASSVRAHVATGDMVRFTSLESDIKSPLSLIKCQGAAQVPEGSLQASYALAFLDHAVYQGAKERVTIYDEAFQRAANKLIADGFASSQTLKMSDSSGQFCYQPGYMVKENEYQCSAESVCSAKVTVGGAVVLVASGKRQPLQTGSVMSLKDFVVDQKENYFLWEGFSRFESISTELAVKLHGK